VQEPDRDPGRDARTPGKVVSCDIMRKADGWFLSLVIECEPTGSAQPLGSGTGLGRRTRNFLQSRLAAWRAVVHCRQKGSVERMESG